MAPARILACQPQREGAHLGWHGRAPALAGRLSPLPAHKRPVPAQQRQRSDQTRAARGGWQVAGRRREQGTIGGARLWPRDLAAQNLELVAQDQQLDVLYVQATATSNDCPKQCPDRDVEEGEGHIADAPSPRADATRHEYWRPSASTMGVSGAALPPQPWLRRRSEPSPFLVAREDEEKRSALLPSQHAPRAGGNLGHASPT